MGGNGPIKFSYNAIISDPKQGNDYVIADLGKKNTVKLEEGKIKVAEELQGQLNGLMKQNGLKKSDMEALFIELRTTVKDKETGEERYQYDVSGGAPDGIASQDEIMKAIEKVKSKNSQNSNVGGKQNTSNSDGKFGNASYGKDGSCQRMVDKSNAKAEQFGTKQKSGPSIGETNKTKQETNNDVDKVLQTNKKKGEKTTKDYNNDGKWDSESGFSNNGDTKITYDDLKSDKVEDRYKNRLTDFINGEINLKVKPELAKEAKNARTVETGSKKKEMPKITAEAVIQELKKGDLDGLSTLRFSKSEPRKTATGEDYHLENGIIDKAEIQEAIKRVVLKASQAETDDGRRFFSRRTEE